MVARHFYRNGDGDMVPVPTVLRWSYALQEAADEGQSPSFEVVVDDPDMTLDFIAHRKWIVYEDDSEDENWVVVAGFVTAQKIAHGGGDILNPAGRVWTLTISDLNTLWTRRLMVGSDATFPAQTDVERMLQLAESEEMGYFHDLTMLSSGSPVNMDKRDGRGTYTGQIADECAQQSGKNYWIGHRGQIVDELGEYETWLWYGHDSPPTYASPIAISNDPAVLDMAAVNDGSATTYPLGADTELRRDGGRQYSGVYVEYEKGAVYRRDTALMEAFVLSGRDLASPAPEIRTKSKAIAYALRELADHATQDEVLSTTITILGNKVTQVRAGMRMSVTATHEPGYETPRWLRILTATPKPVGRRAGLDVYEVALELQGPGAPGAYSCSAALAAMSSDVDTSLTTVTGATASNTIAVTDDGYLVGIVIAECGNTPDSTGMGSPSGYTNLDARDFSRATWFIGYKAAAAGNHTMSASYTGGFGDDVWLAAQAWLPWSNLTVVQETNPAGAGAIPITLGSTPTPGNTILMFAISGSPAALTPGGASGGPSTGWTLLFNDQESVSNCRIQVSCWARCVQEGDGLIYDYSYTTDFLMGQTTYVVEIATS